MYACRPKRVFSHLRSFDRPNLALVVHAKKDLAGLDEGIPALSLYNLVYMDNPYMYQECQ